ncbi:DUF559 domain-containing protein [Vibrio sp. THAF190c]|uniref:DUF559 domain-containing protein n=1 Tax=Vibrio sp. THAF190c TaxID=2587865 RepID=UPI001268F485|nr:DUF559 domain-containing protein [Vibrio sp. THAF190c]QFT13513.1 hypothetical protein FIV04_26520 [Vibrio sp. THAF190c]
MITWKDWKQKYKDEIWHIAGFEEAFVDNILSRLPVIEPKDVIPQFKFYDDQGKTRYIDFLIANEAKGYMLPIELDGLAKDQNHKDWGDFLKRQNALVTKFGIVLRFTNKQMFNDSHDVINKIQQTLSLQHERTLRNASNKSVDQRPNFERKPGVPAPEDTDNVAATSKNKSIILVAALVLIAFFSVLLAQSNVTPNKESIAIKPKSDIQAESIDNWEEVPEVEIQLELGGFHSEKPPITTSEARYHVGSQRTTCGVLIQVSNFSKGTYLNFDQPFPKTRFTGVIWDSDKETVSLSHSSLMNLVGKTVCVNGEISTYNNRQQTIITQPNQLKFN